MFSYFDFYPTRCTSIDISCTVGRGPAPRRSTENSFCVASVKAAFAKHSLFFEMLNPSFAAGASPRPTTYPTLVPLVK